MTGSDLADIFVWTRAVHFVAMVSMAGAIVFAMFVGEPALRSANCNENVASTLRSRLAGIIWLSLLAGFISAWMWLVLLTARLGDVPAISVLSGGPLWMVLSETDFGQIWAVRLLLMAVLAAILLLRSPLDRSRSLPGSRLALAVGLVASLAWAGHAAANMGSDLKGNAHLLGDILHLVAAAAWVGALVPLVLLLNLSSDEPLSLLKLSRIATLRFSTLGIVSVATILLTGLNNTWVLAGSIRALTGTDYGHVLVVKLMLFLLMLGLATFNRFKLTPLVVQDNDISAAWQAVRRLRRNAMAEAALGVLILIIVAVLGMMSPGSEDMGEDMGRDRHLGSATPPVDPSAAFVA
jgi:putative copper resistance protein D